MVVLQCEPLPLLPRRDVIDGHGLQLNLLHLLLVVLANGPPVRLAVGGGVTLGPGGRTPPRHAPGDRHAEVAEAPKLHRRRRRGAEAGVDRRVALKRRRRPGREAAEQGGAGGAAAQRGGRPPEHVVMHSCRAAAAAAAVDLTLRTRPSIYFVWQIGRV